ncbi:WD40 repeat-like protein [Suillus brevipes Sb2]|nr:WD40 repeat-like protein [Suillus brevipes Sb2]
MDQFSLCCTLEGHSSPINSVSFSEGGYLASGSDDGHIILWSLAEECEVLRIRPKQGAITSLKWVVSLLTSAEWFLLSGGADGTLQLRKLSNDKRTNVLLSMHTVFASAISCIDVNDARSMIAVTGPGRVVLFKIAAGNLDPIQCISADPPFSQDPKPAFAISVHFFQQGKGILVCYLDSHEIVALCVSPWKELWRQKLVNRIGSSAYFDSLSYLLVWNLLDGIEVYQLTDNPTCHLLLIRTLRVRIKRNHICDVQFDCTGKSAISGNDNGEVHLWDINRGQVKQVLPHGKELSAVQTIAYYSAQNGKDFIASASSEPGDSFPTIKVWSTGTQRVRILFPYDRTTTLLILLMVQDACFINTGSIPQWQGT